MYKLTCFLCTLFIASTLSLANANSNLNSQLQVESDPAAQHQLGLRYANGLGVKKSKKKARDWFVKAANQGYLESKYELGKLYSSGRLKEAAYAVAANWFEEAANEDHNQAQYSLGMLYSEGKGVERNPEVAMTWFAKSAELGNADAQLKMASSTSDAKTKIAWFTKAAQQGDARAQKSLGDIYYSGDLVPKDDFVALEWYQRAAENGNRRAHLQLGKLYETSNTSLKNQDTALYWYQKSADLELTLGYFNAKRILKERCEQSAVVSLFEISLKCSSRDEITDTINLKGGLIDYVNSTELTDRFPEVQLFNETAALELDYTDDGKLHKLTYTLVEKTSKKALRQLSVLMLENDNISVKSSFNESKNADVWVMQDGEELHLVHSPQKLIYYSRINNRN